ncbi:hypothetical protein [Pseudomonas mucidolens]|uniref:hypothetical protein n=1 Tax=Pseudomonas mucidolens TaxID=46679 RepID=UPI0030D91B1E
MLAKIVNDDAENLTPRGDLKFFANKLAPTESGSVFDLDLRRPVNHAGRTQALRSGYPGMDAGIAALGHGWPVAAAHGAMPERGHTEPERGAEWWGKSVLLTFALFKSESL